jgi:uncharacterized protein YceK
MMIPTYGQTGSRPIVRRGEIDPRMPAVLIPEDYRRMGIEASSTRPQPMTQANAGKTVETVEMVKERVSRYYRAVGKHKSVDHPSTNDICLSCASEWFIIVFLGGCPQMKLQRKRTYFEVRQYLLFTLCISLAMMAMLLLSGCSSSSAQTTKPAGYDLNEHYSTELNAARDKLKAENSKFGLDVLQDGVVTEAELNELSERYNQCYIDHGFQEGTFSFDKNGEGSIYPPSGLSKEENLAWGEKTHEVQLQCDAKDGSAAIRALVSAVTINPENKDMRKEIIRCLAKNNIVGQSYGPDDYDTDLRNQTGPFSPDKKADESFQKKLRDCQS